MRKTALCIGINDYPGTRLDLRGCVNDAQDWQAALLRRGFAVQTLLDAQATKAAMVEKIATTIGEAERGDSVVITYSGHGTLAPDLDGDEDDGYDEALCPYDIKEGNPLIDDEIHRLFAARAQGVHLLLISDSCHSGTVTRAAAPDPIADGAMTRFMPIGAWLPDADLPRGARGRVLTRIALTNTLSPWAGALIHGSETDLLMAGCEEGPNRFSFDARFDGRCNGAFTHYALRALAQLPANATYAHWYGEIRKWLPSLYYPQTPQLFGSKTARKRVALA